MLIYHMHALFLVITVLRSVSSNFLIQSIKSANMTFEQFINRVKTIFFSAIETVLYLDVFVHLIKGFHNYAIAPKFNFRTKQNELMSQLIGLLRSQRPDYCMFFHRSTYLVMFGPPTSVQHPPFRHLV